MPIRLLDSSGDLVFDFPGLLETRYHTQVCDN